ncbi:MAG: ABC transporter ATP-binding protein [Acidobacteria bacterium]|nr:ABC transporter ATP-binding protein [Acidobacteriota bacterium]
MFEVRGLTKRYPRVTALDDVSFRIAPGEILGYLGPNGSGKSTTIKIITGLVDASAGRVTLHGIDAEDDPAAFRARLGYVPEEPHLYTHLTAPEYLRLVGRLRGLDATRLEIEIVALLRLLDLEPAFHAVMTSYSKGMRQRVLLAAALLHDPDLLILDEPFSGLDVSAALLLQTLLKALVRRGKMILFSSHQMQVVEALCERVVILHKGRIVAEGSPRALEAAGDARSLEEAFALVTEQEDYGPRVDAMLEAVSRR